MSEPTLHDILHILRNPHGWTPDAIRAAQLAACDLLEAAAPVPAREWIPVGERLPDEDVLEVLEWSRLGAAVVFAECLQIQPNRATHWMPLPEPPSEHDKGPASANSPSARATATSGAGPESPDDVVERLRKPLGAAAEVGDFYYRLTPDRADEVCIERRDAVKEILALRAQWIKTQVPRERLWIENNLRRLISLHAGGSALSEFYYSIVKQLEHLDAACERDASPSSTSGG